MTPEQNERALEAAEAIKSLAEEASAAEPLARPMLRLAEACLELVVSGVSWSEGHAYVRDRGAFRWRDSLARQCAALGLLLSEALRELAVHGRDAARDQDLATRVEALSAALAVTIGGLEGCEAELRERLLAPRLAEIALRQRLESLGQAPVASREAIRQLAAAVDVQQGDVGAREAEVAALTRQRDGLEARRAAAAREHAALSASLDNMQAELDRLRAEEQNLSAERASRDMRLASVRQRVASLRSELGALAQDPRAEIAAAVQRALAALPADAFDRLGPS